MATTCPAFYEVLVWHRLNCYFSAKYFLLKLICKSFINFA